MKSRSYIPLYFLIVTLILDHVLSTATGNGCPDTSENWRDLGGNFCYIVEKNKKVTWMDAVYSCFSQGGSLASFQSIEEIQRVVNHGNAESIGLYIGLWKHYDGSLEWIDKSALRFRNWNPGEPNFDSERCVEFYVDSGKWNDVDCSKELGYICSQIKTPPRSNALPLRLRKVCPGNSLRWTDFGGNNCYIIETRISATWRAALNKCQQEGGSLASFHSVEEISAVLQRTRTSSEGFHIGLRQNNKGEFKWADKTRIDLDYWTSGIPKRSEKICGAMNPQNGQWYNEQCEKFSAYICSAPKGPCGRDIQQDSGTIHSPNYPGNYGANEDCTWSITVPEGQRVALHFQTFALEYYTSNCSADFVQVLDGHEPGSPVLATLCGLSVPGTIRSSGNKMAVRFVTDYEYERPGFLLTFTKTIICDENFVAEEGIIESPNYPNNYGPGEKCVWKIAVPEGLRVYVSFRKFQVEDSHNCAKDFVEIRDGRDETSPVLGRFCGSTVPQGILSSGNEVSVVFESDLSTSTEWSGFTAKFQKDMCGGEHVLNFGMISSPKHPNYYRKNEACTWKITVPGNNPVALQFLAFNLEQDSDCSNDFVEVRDGHEFFSPLLGRFCGDTLPAIIRSSTNKITVTFMTDELEERSGFLARFMEGEICDEKISAETGIIESPNYPMNYGPAEKCIWNITVPGNHRVSLRFLTFNVEYSQNCKADFVEIRDGHEATSRVLARFCGYFIPDSITESSGNKMAVVFASDLSIEQLGFSATFEKGTCGEDIIAGRGIISSPNYPKQYGKNESCIWKITVPENYVVALQFQSIDLEIACVYDYVEVRDGHEPDSLLLGKFCGKEVPKLLRSSTNKLTVKFASDATVEKQGFSAKFVKEISTRVQVETLVREESGEAAQDAIYKTKEKLISEYRTSDKLKIKNP